MHRHGQRPLVTKGCMLGLCLGALAILTVNSRSIATTGKVTEKTSEELKVRADTTVQSPKAHFSKGLFNFHQSFQRLLSINLLPSLSADVKRKAERKIQLTTDGVPLKANETGSKCCASTIGSNIIERSDDNHYIRKYGKKTQSDSNQPNSSEMVRNYRTLRDVTTAQPCSSGWKLEGQSCYRMTSVNTWAAARLACHSWNGLLAEIPNLEQQRELQHFLDSQQPSVSSAWIGLMDKQTVRQWTWESGMKATFFYWLESERNSKHGEENCVNVGPGSNFRWNDNACNATLQGVCQQAQPCGSSWKLEGQSCYRLTSQKTWDAARLACQSWNGVLAEIHNLEQQLELQDFLGSPSYSYLQQPSVLSAWIGLSNRRRERQWTWDSGINATFFNWFKNEPNNKDGKEDCVNVWPGSNATWNDYACDATFAGVCQKGCADSSALCQLLSQRGLCTNALFQSYMDYACRRSCLRC